MRLWRVSVALANRCNLYSQSMWLGKGGLSLDSRIVAMVLHEHDEYLKVTTERHVWHVRMGMGLLWAWRTT